MIKDLWHLYFREKIDNKAATLSFYLLLAFPIVIISIIHFGSFILPTEYIKTIVISWSEFLAINQVSYLISSFTVQSLPISILSLVVLLLLATKGFAYLYESINSIWGTHWLSAPVFNRVVASVILVVLSFFLATSFLIDTLLSKVIGAFKQVHEISVTTSVFLYTMTTVLLLIVLLTILYKLLIDAKTSWRVVIIASIVTTFLFIVLKNVFGFFFSYGEIASLYGALGSFVVLLTWTYIQAQIFYIGALIIKILQKRM